MRIAILHSFYGSGMPSGENAIVMEQVDALAEAGHDVTLIARYTDNESERTAYPLRAAYRTITGRGPSPLPELRDFAPDVVHVHNLFPNFGTRWLRDWPGPIVATLHNFRALCANGLLFRDGHHCEDCPSGSSISALRHRCYHNSLAATVPLAIRNGRGLSANDLMREASALVCLSPSAAEIFTRYGLESGRMAIIPNGIDDPGPTPEPGAVHGWVVAGRLSPEKGILELARAWPTDRALDVIGDGPQAAAIHAIAGPLVRMLGQQPHDELLRILPQHLGLILPSRCIEMQPTIAIEAMAVGIPVVALAGSAAARLVEEYACGVTYTDSTDLPHALDAAEEQRNALGAAGRTAFVQNFSRSAWLRGIEALYDKVLTGAAA